MSRAPKRITTYNDDAASQKTKEKKSVGLFMENKNDF